MNKAKYVFILLLVFLLSGCDATYKLTIDGDKKIEESIILEEKYNLLLTFSNNPTNYMNEQLKSLKESSKYDLYDMETYTKDSKGYGSANRKYNNLDDYKNNSTVTSELFSKISFEQVGDIMSLTMKPVENLEYFMDADEYNSLLDNLNIEINLPYKVVDTNGKKIEDNTYKWSFKKDQSLSEINLSFDLSKNLNNKIPLSIIIIIGSASVLLIVGFYVYIRYKRNSR